MKNTKLLNILKKGNIVIPIFLLQNYKELKLKLDEFIFLMYLYNLGDSFLFDPNKYANDLNLELGIAMGYIDSLTEKGFIQVKVMKDEKGLMEEVVLLENFFNKLTMFTMNEINKDSNVDHSNIFEIIEKEFGRTLGPIDYEIIRAWLDNNMSEDLIKEALKEATLNGVTTLRYIDKILYEWKKNNIKTVKDVEENRKKRSSKKDDNSKVDLDMVDWNWFEDED